jgi:two-component system, NarL family, sensor histidine kinase DesK
MTAMRWWGWSRLTQVERVDLYTRQSLYLLLWLSVLLALLSGTDDARESSSEFAAVAVAAALLAGAATFVMRDVFRLYPDLGPLPWRSIGPFLALSTVVIGFGLARADTIRTLAVTSVFLTAGWSLGGLRRSVATVVIVAALAVLPAVAYGEAWFFPAGIAAAAFFVFTVRVSLWLLGVVTELDQAQHAQSALAVAEERLRFSRDVHDVLGRRLSTIAVQAELAATLAERSDERSAARMLEVRSIAHEALREARELARGYRTTDLHQELEGARSLLRSAGIDVRLDVDGLPQPWQEVAGWVVREAVTNVLRHSTATTVTIQYAAPALTVANDGAGRSSAEAAGSGIDGLRERLTRLGADLAVARDDRTFTLVATLPGAGPREVVS